MSMAQLVAAGAPELPEGYFYRVRPFMRSGLRVEIRRRQLVGSVAEEFGLTWPSEHYDDGLRLIVNACCRVHRKWLDREADAGLLRDAKTFVGDHDPRGGA
jgi:hypothetical protein